MSEFESISKIESFALNHFIYSTPFNQMLNGKIDAKRKRIVMMILGLNWVLIFLIFSKMIPVLNEIILPYKVDFFSVLKDDKNSYIIMTTAYLTTICYLKTDFLINESSSYMLIDVNLLKNGFTNRLNEKNLQKIKIYTKFVHRILNIFSQFAKICFTLFFSIYFFIILFDNAKFDDTNILKMMICCVLYAFWITGILHAIDLSLIYATLIILGVNYLKLRFDQVNEKILNILNNKKRFNYKKLFKVISEHKSIETKTELYNSALNRCAACALAGITIGIIANLYIVTFSSNNIHKMFSLLSGSGAFIFELIIMLKVVMLSDSAHQSYANLNSIIIRRKMNLRTKLRVRVVEK